MPSAICPECDERIHINESIEQGDLVVCDICDTDLELVGLDPFELDPYFDKDSDDYDDGFNIFADDLDD
jgi:alpha-aminoadipate carrier protein LysW